MEQLTSQEREVEPLGVEHTLWANTVVASGDAIAVVIYTGELNSIFQKYVPRNRNSRLSCVVTFSTYLRCHCRKEEINPKLEQIFRACPDVQWAIHRASLQAPHSPHDLQALLCFDLR